MKYIKGKGTTNYQKAIYIVLSFASICAAIPIIVHDFVIEPFVSELAIYISILLTALVIFIIIYLYKKGQWHLGLVWEQRSKFLNVLSFPVIVLALCLLFWINIAISAPKIYTVLLGQEKTKNEIIIKGIRSRGCYKLHLKSTQLFFHHCLSKKQYDSLPDKHVLAELVVKESMFGYILKEVRLIHK